MKNLKNSIIYRSGEVNIPKSSKKPLSREKRALPREATESFSPPSFNKERILTKDFADSYDLPYYDLTSLTLLARDPHWIYAYWDISLSSVEELKKSLGRELENAAHTLRMHDVTFVNFDGNNSNHWFDLDFDPGRTNNWYINLWRDNASYCGEIGIRFFDGKFYPLTRSNVATTPRKHAAARSEEIWMRVDDTSSGAPFVKVMPERAGAEKENNSIAPPRTQKRIYLSENDIKAYYSGLSPLLKDVLARRLAKFKENYGAVDKGGKNALSDFLRGGLTERQFLKKIISGASEELVLAGGASEMGASERNDVKRKFFFEVGTELIVYGRTEPDASVCLNERQIPLRDDGTFTLRFALPDGGKIPLDFTARSGDKIEKRRIVTGAERASTKYE